MMDSPEETSAQPSAAARSEPAWTVGRLLTWTTGYLKRSGSNSPRLDAEVMLAFALSWERVKLYTHFELEVDDQARARFRDLVRQRAAGAPVAYLVGRKEFFSLAFEVGPDVLIPRPESEFVVVEFLECTRDHGPVRAVDVGTGSGCLAVAALHHEPKARFVAIDRCPKALLVASSNALRHGVAERIEFREGDLLEPVRGDEPYDVILSNPPYIPTDQIEHLDPCVRDHEPRAALDGGPDGLAIVTRLVEQSIPLLKPGGRIILEIGFDQEQAVRKLLARAEFELAPTIRDLSLHPRVVHAARV